MTLFEGMWWLLENGYFFADGLPDASSRKIALGGMVTAIKDNNFQDKKYGFTYWTDTAFASPMKNPYFKFPSFGGVRGGLYRHRKQLSFGSFALQTYIKRHTNIAYKSFSFFGNLNSVADKFEQTDLFKFLELHYDCW